MQDHGFGAVAVKDVLVIVSGAVLRIKQMAKQFLAKRFEQEILGFKMRIESRSAYICAVDNIPNGYLVIMLFEKKLGESVKNSFPCFSLPSVHLFSPYIFRNLFHNE